MERAKREFEALEARERERLQREQEAEEKRKREEALAIERKRHLEELEQMKQTTKRCVWSNNSIIPFLLSPGGNQNH